MSSRFNAFKEGAVYYGPCFIVAIICGYPGLPWPVFTLGVVSFILGVYTLFFFRDPPRRIPTDPDALVAPADGKVVGVERLENTPHYEGPCLRISIFLSLFNVHVNRAPCVGKVRHIEYKPGRFKNAMAAETSEINEATTIRLDTGFGPVTVRQISGLVARRIVWKIAPGDALQKGEKFGMIKFGSRTELYLPEDAAVCVKVKDKVRAGSSILARITVHAESDPEKEALQTTETAQP